MGRSWLLSSLLHAALAVVLWFGLPGWGRPLPAIESGITVELVTEADLRPPEPEVAAVAPEPERQAARPEPIPPAPKPAPEALPEPEPVVAPEPVRAEPEPEPAPEPEPEPQVVRAEPEPAPPPEPEPEPEPAPVAEPEPEPEQQAALEPEPPATAPPPASLPKPQVKPAPPPAPEPQPAKAAPKPEPEPPQPKAESEPATPEPPKEDDLAWLRSIEETVQRKQAEIEQSGAGRALEGAGQVRTTVGDARPAASELAALGRALKSEIERCWLLVGVDGTEDMVVQLRIVMGPDRTVREARPVDRGRFDRDPKFRAVAESALRAVDKCSPLQSVAGYPYSEWREIVMNFDPPL
jgi:hypothetical protein